MVTANPNLSPAREQASTPEALLDEYITLGQAAKALPGRPSTNCVWRWCRRGVLARSGERITLEHVRVGGKIFTTKKWLTDFGRRLAAADVAHFESRAAAATGSFSSADDKSGEDHRSHIERELEEAGL